MRNADEAPWVAKIAAEFGNLQAAHVWAVDNTEVDFEARLLVALWNYGLQRLSAEYFSWVEEAIEKLSFEDHALLAAELHGIAALAAWLRGDLRQSMRSCRSAFEAEQRLTSGMSVPARMAIVVASAYCAARHPGARADRGRGTDPVPRGRGVDTSGRRPVLARATAWSRGRSAWS